jgi:hypothetical protein
MSPYMERRLRQVVPLSVVALVVAAMLSACASEPTKTEVPAAPPTPPAPVVVAPAPAPPPRAAPAVPARPAAPASPPTVEPLPTTPPVAPAAKPAFPDATTYFVHRVQYPGETVSIIAAWYLGDKMRFDVLAAANPEINPKLVKAGMSIRIPENMMKTHEPMPKDFVDSFYGRSKKGVPTASGPAKDKDQDEEEPVLIGPKESPPK